MTPETEARLNAIRERHAASTPGEWEYDQYAEIVRVHNWPSSLLDCGGFDQSDADGKFAAESHQDIPWLLDTVIPELQARIKDMQSILREIQPEMRHEHDTGDGHFSTEQVETVERLMG